MTEQTNADLIAWLRRDHNFETSPLGRDYTDEEIATTLEAAEQRAESAERQVEIRQNDSIAARIARQNARAVEEWVRLNQERNELAAVVEKVRERNTVDMDTLDDRSEFHQGIRHAASNMEDILATTPADLLREREAALIEGLAHEIRHKQHAESIRQMLLGKARQRRGGSHERE